MARVGVRTMLARWRGRDIELKSRGELEAMRAAGAVVAAALAAVSAVAKSGMSTKELDAVVEFRVPEDELVTRLLGRGRDDDTEDVIRNRQQVYRAETTPLLEFYADLLVSVDALGSVEEITSRVLAALRSP